MDIGFIGLGNMGQPMARRLIEAGVRLVTVNMFETVFDEVTWDIHGSRPFTDINEMAKLVAPAFDLGYSTLLEDLKERGLYDSTVVIAMGEFGRTPKINPDAGRDHWPSCYTLVLAGGGVRRGFLYSASDRIAAYPQDRPVTPADVAATLYWALGIDPQAEIRDQQGRPLPLTTGTPVLEWFQ